MCGLRQVQCGQQNNVHGLEYTLEATHIKRSCDFQQMAVQNASAQLAGHLAVQIQ